MSYIQFESASELEKARQDLREARENILNDAKKQTERRADAEAKIILRGEKNWMLPSINDKLKKKNKKLEKNIQKKSKKHSKKSKKSKKKRNKSSSEDGSDSSETGSSSDNNENYSKIKQKFKHKKKSKSKSNKCCDGDYEGSDDKKQSLINLKKTENPLERDSWMTDTIILKTYSKDRVENTRNEKQQIHTYDPVKSSLELNPYWKTTGTGLPAFQKPKEEDESECKKAEKSQFLPSIRIKGWRKQSDNATSGKLQKAISKISSDDKSSCSDGELGDEKTVKYIENTYEFLTDQQMNELGAKLLKAEIMGNMKLADELREKLEEARTQRNIFKERQKTSYIEGRNKSNSSKDNQPNMKADSILLTYTDKVGNTRPLPLPKDLDPKNVYGGKKKQKSVASHDEYGKRLRYFADDDHYDIKQMFEKEKYTSASDTNLQFASVAGKHKNLSYDLEDIFEEKLCKDDSVRSDRRDRSRAIREYEQIEATIDQCDKCFESVKMQKELLVCVGENVYLALPWYQGLQDGHCIILSHQHTSCSTLVDENTWIEINDFRKALTRMFATQHKEVIFFEIANKLHRRPHLAIHCIPISESDGEMAPFYFKKSIEESEADWCVNKQLVSLQNKSLRNSIPKGLPYFWVNFGMDTGFAHVIEDEERFPPNFAQEIIGGMLNLDANKWRKLQKNQNVITKVKIFAEWWEKFDCTV